MNMKKVWGIAFAVLSAITFALSPALCKFAYAAGWGDICMTFVSMAMAAVMLLVLCLIKRISLRITVKEFRFLLAAAAGCFAAVLLYNMAAGRIPGGATTSIHYLNPALIMIGSIIFFGFKLTWIRVLSAVCNVVGVFFFFQRGGNMLLGSLMALGSAVFYALYSLVVDYSVLNTYDALKLSFYITLFSAVFCGITTAVTGSFEIPEGMRGITWVVLLAVTSDVLGMLFFQSAIKRIGATQTTMTATLEPLTSIVLGAILFGEALNLKVAAGCILIIAGVVLNAVSTMKSDNPKTGHE